MMFTLSYIQYTNIDCKLASLGYICGEASTIYTILLFICIIDLAFIVTSKQVTPDFLFGVLLP